MPLSPLALGENPATAYRGDRGAAAYAHAVTNKGDAFSSDLYKITTNAEGHVTAATPVTEADIIEFLNEQAITPSSVTASGTIQGSSISDGVGTLVQLRESINQTYTDITATTNASGNMGTGISKSKRIFGAQLTSSADLVVCLPYSNSGRNDWGLALKDGSLAYFANKSVTVRVYHS